MLPCCASKPPRRGRKLFCPCTSLQEFAGFCNPFPRRARAMLDVHQRLSKVIKGYQSLKPRPRHPTPNGGKLHQTAPEIFPVLRRSGSPKEDAPLDQSQATGLSHTSVLKIPFPLPRPHLAKRASLDGALELWRTWEVNSAKPTSSPTGRARQGRASLVLF